MASTTDAPALAGNLHTTMLTVRSSEIKVTPSASTPGSLLGDWTLDLPEASPGAVHLRRAAHELRNTNVPVAFPTETVYGLGADATRSLAVKGIFNAKQRPADNPLIVHVHSVGQLRALLQPTNITHAGPVSIGKPPGLHMSEPSKDGDFKADHVGDTDPIPRIYLPLIEQFWPGPLTLIMPNPQNTILAPEVTAGLQTFGVRMPKNAIALALLKMADIPLAAPSANASTKPSPTTAQHVMDDLAGRISHIIDGGPCSVGVESTVVDGLSHPPTILRPGGITIDDLRACPGWEQVAVGYKNASELDSKPRAPGMKYKHYSPRATVILHESGSQMPTEDLFLRHMGQRKSMGIVRTSLWPFACGLAAADSIPKRPLTCSGTSPQVANGDVAHGPAIMDGYGVTSTTGPIVVQIGAAAQQISLWDIALGGIAEDVAMGLFAALRELDLKNVDAILVEGIEEIQGDIAAAVMNRLRKAAEVMI